MNEIPRHNGILSSIQGVKMTFIKNKKVCAAIIILCLSFVFPINSFAQSFIDDASQYTVRFRVLVDHPFVEDTDKEEITKKAEGLIKENVVTTIWKPKNFDPQKDIKK